MPKGHNLFSSKILTAIYKIYILFYVLCVLFYTKMKAPECQICLSVLFIALFLSPGMPELPWFSVNIYQRN